MRKSWEQHWMEEARHAAEMCTCVGGRKVGAVFVRDNRLLTTGFNGVPAGFDHPLVCKRREANIPSGEQLEMCGCAHAEANGIANAARDGVRLHGCVVYCTNKPCVMCMGALANVGVKEVYWEEDYPHPMADLIAEKAGINVMKYITVMGQGMIKLD